MELGQRQMVDTGIVIVMDLNDGHMYVDTWDWIDKIFISLQLMDLYIQDGTKTSMMIIRMTGFTLMPMEKCIVDGFNLVQNGTTWTNLMVI